MARRRSAVPTSSRAVGAGHPGTHDHTATVATEIGTTFVTDQRDLAHFSDAFTTLDAVALHDDTARALLERIDSDYEKPC